MNIVNLDHLVLTVRSLAATVTFYESVLGMTRETYGENRVALRFGNQRINLHEHGKEFEPKASQPLPGSADLCFMTDTTLEEAMAQVKNKGITILEGPVTRTGATGTIISFYFRDPDGNLIEVANLSPDLPLT
jgi:catechol 2,3-dioxygenase-like lactoylglutathione lyase family enzyme